MDFKEQLTAAIADSVRKILPELFATGEHFYYITLTVVEEPTVPCLSAWSHEALAKAAPEEREMIKWSYADSPYYCIGEEHFANVADFLEDYPLYNLDDDAYDAEYVLRLSAMEEAMRRLDAEGLFGTGTERSSMLIMAEIMPPNSTNIERAYRLNDGSTEIFREWLAEAAESEP